MEKRRQIENNILALKEKQYARILVFTGARQVGKTTLVKQLLPDYTYLSIEDPIKRKSYLNMTAQQWEALYPKAILDEVQKEPLLIESIKATYDTYGNVRYVLLGSSQLLLLEKVKESPTIQSGKKSIAILSSNNANLSIQDFDEAIDYIWKNNLLKILKVEREHIYIMKIYVDVAQ